MENKHQDHLLEVNDLHNQVIFVLVVCTFKFVATKSLDVTYCVHSCRTCVTRAGSTSYIESGGRILNQTIISCRLEAAF